MPIKNLGSAQFITGDPKQQPSQPSAAEIMVIDIMVSRAAQQQKEIQRLKKLIDNTSKADTTVLELIINGRQG